MKHPVDDSYRLLAAQYIRKQIRQLTGQIEGIRKADDIEHVHRARVASRRLRSALSVFPDCFAEKKVKAWRKAIRELTRGLGDARDKDVQIAFVRDALDQLHDKAWLPGILGLLVYLVRQRDVTQPAVLHALDRLQTGRVLDKMMTKTKQMSKGLEERGVTVVSEQVLAHAERQILAGVDSLLALESSLADPQDIGQHHALRIAAKRLRYAVEICRPAYSGRMDEILSAIKQAQTLLGAIHDCDVWVAYLDAYLESQQKRIIRLYGHSGPLDRLRVGIDGLRRDRQAERAQLFEKLVAYWHDLSEHGFWDALVELVRLRPEPAKPPKSQAADKDRPDRGAARKAVPPSSEQASNGKRKGSPAADAAGLPPQAAR
jgi:CHAD domain-containing protein